MLQQSSVKKPLTLILKIEVLIVTLRSLVLSIFLILWPLSQTNHAAARVSHSIHQFCPDWNILFDDSAWLVLVLLKLIAPQTWSCGIQHYNNNNNISFPLLSFLFLFSCHQPHFIHLIVLYFLFFSCWCRFYLHITVSKEWFTSTFPLSLAPRQWLIVSFGRLCTTYEGLWLSVFVSVYSCTLSPQQPW